MLKYLLMLAGCVLAVSAVPAQLHELQFEEYTLPNGLHVILHQDKSTPIVAVSVMYHVGSKNENPNRTGFAHFFEHLLFEGSENIKRGEFDKYVEKAGGTLNANTWFDRTYYYEILPSNQFKLGLWLESERMLHAKVEDIGIETQRQVVKEERRQRVDNQPYGTVLEEVLKRAYKVHPYRWTVIGSMDHLDAATESDYKNFYEEFYVPNNAVLSIAGDIDIAETKAEISKYFGPIPKGKEDIYRPTVVEPALGGEVRDVIEDEIQLPAVIHAYRIPEQGSDDFYAIALLGNLISKGNSSRMHKALVEDQQKAMMVVNFPLALENPGLALTYAIASFGTKPEDLEASMDEILEDIKAGNITDEEFQKLHNQEENDFVNNIRSMAGIAENLANYHMYYGDANLINTELNRYLQVTKEDLIRVANQYFVKDNRVALFYVPITTP